MEYKKRLEIHMFGKFEMIYNGQVLNLGHSQTTKAMKLLQLLLFCGEDGIHRSQIVQHLFGVDAEGNIQTNLRVVVHNLRKILEKAGMADDVSILIEAGVYRLTSNFEVVVDAKKFEHLIQEAKKTSDLEQYLLLRKAFDLYKGYFLPEIYGDDWVVVNSARYQNLYTECLEQLIAILKEKGDYRELYKICNYASSLYPLDEWQVYEMEALVALGDAEAAIELYEKTTSMYFDELSMPPSDEMMECFQHMREQLNMKTRNILEVQGEMNEKEYQKGAFFCHYPSFADSYRMINRIMERSGQSCYLLMCTLYDDKGQMLEESEFLKDVSDVLYCSIRDSLRRGDVFTRYNIRQYLVMLMGIRKEECAIVTGRIDANFRKRCTNRKVRIHFHVSSVSADLENM